MLLTTITSRIGFYARAGFTRLEMKDIPRWTCCAHEMLHARSDVLSMLELRRDGRAC